MRPWIRTRGGPALLPVHQPRVLFLDRLEVASLQRGVLRVTDGVLHTALAIGIGDPGRIGHGPVVRQHRCIQRVELGLVEVGLDDTLLEIIQDDILDGAPEVAKRLLMQPAPGALIRRPAHVPVGAPRVAQRHHEQPGPAHLARDRVAGRCSQPPVHLRLFPRGELQPVILRRIARPQAAHEPLHAVVAMGKTQALHQVLVERHRGAAKANLLIDPLAVRLTRRAGLGWHRSRLTGLVPRRPPWPVLGLRAGGHPLRRGVGSNNVWNSVIKSQTERPQILWVHWQYCHVVTRRRLDMAKDEEVDRWAGVMKK